MRTSALVLLIAAAVALPAAADTVRLKNGRAYEGVIAERTPQGVRIRLAFGYLVIPDAQVLTVETAPSSLAAYLKRRAALEARADAPASEWLDLARWAKVNDLPTASRQAALLAAELDPRLPGLDAMLRPLGLVFEEALARWIPYEEAMARRGLVRFAGEWVSVDEKRQRMAELDRQRAADEQAAASRRMAAAAEALERAELVRAERDARERAAQLAVPVYLPMATFPGFWLPSPVVVVLSPQGPGPGPVANPHPRHTFSSLMTRQPGTFLAPDDDSFWPGLAPRTASTVSSSSGG